MEVGWSFHASIIDGGGVGLYSGLWSTPGPGGWGRKDKTSASGGLAHVCHHKDLSRATLVWHMEV